MNPITTLDSILSDWASPRARRLVHALIALVLLIVTAYFAAGGDWAVAVPALLATVYAAMNKANTPATALTTAGVDDTVDDGLTYEQAGGAPFPEGDTYVIEPPMSHTTGTIYQQVTPMHQPGSDEDGFGGDAPKTDPFPGDNLS